MKNIFLITLSFLFSITTFASNIKVEPKVDKRIELLSTVFRLAGAHEYVANNLEAYTKEVDASFRKFKNHKVVKLAQKARRWRGVSYDAVASMATSIEITENGIQLQPNLTDESLEKRWNRKKVGKFIEALNDFYKVSEFESFFDDHQTFYAQTESSFLDILNKVDFKWFESFYGEKPKGDFRLVLAMLNGYSNYGSTNDYQDGKEEIYAIIGVSKMGDDGIPVFNGRNLELIIHEFNHSFCNKLMEAEYENMKTKSQEIYNLVKDNLRRQAYGSPLTMNCEILVRAGVIQYYKEKQLTDNIQSMIGNEQGRGFLWIDKLCYELDNYQQEREKYASLSDYMPEIVRLQNNLDVPAMWEAYDMDRGQIVSFNIENGSTEVDPDFDTLIVTFDQPMLTNKNGISYGKKGKKYYPVFPKDRKFYWNEETKKQWIVPIELEPGRKYSLSFPDFFFRTAKYKTLKKTYYLDFETRKE
jgi:hypothetical protein